MKHFPLIAAALIAGILVGSGGAYAFMRRDTGSTTQTDSMSGMDHRSMEMASGTMKDMDAPLDGKTGDDFDKAFLSLMIEHHQGAIDMANRAKENATHSELKAMADDIISAQAREIEQMKSWQGEWGY